MLSIYVPLVTLAALALAFALFSVVLATVVGPSIALSRLQVGAWSRPETEERS